MKIAFICAFSLITLLPNLANAAQDQGAAKSCGNAPQALLYRAHFQDSSAWEKPRASRELTLEVGKDAWGATIARIRSGAQCEAVCSIRRIDPQSGLAAQSMDLDCRSPKLGHLVTPATVLWASPRGSQVPTLRFGTWLKGYATAPLRVEIDRFKPSPAVELARAEK